MNNSISAYKAFMSHKIQPTNKVNYYLILKLKNLNSSEKQKFKMLCFELFLYLNTYLDNNVLGEVNKNIKINELNKYNEIGLGKRPSLEPIVESKNQILYRINTNFNYSKSCNFLQEIKKNLPSNEKILRLGIRNALHVICSLDLVDKAIKEFLYSFTSLESLFNLFSKIDLSFSYDEFDVLKIKKTKEKFFMQSNFLNNNHLLIYLNSFDLRRIDLDNIFISHFDFSIINTSYLTPKNKYLVHYDKIAGLNFINSDFLDVKFSSKDIIECNFKNSKLRKSYFKSTKINQSKFENVQFHEVDFSNSNICRANFLGANFFEVNFNDATFDRIKFDNAVFKNVLIYNAKFIHCSFSNVIEFELKYITNEKIEELFNELIALANTVFTISNIYVELKKNLSNQILNRFNIEIQRFGFENLKSVIDYYMYRNEHQISKILLALNILNYDIMEIIPNIKQNVYNCSELNLVIYSELCKQVQNTLLTDFTLNIEQVSNNLKVLSINFEDIPNAIKESGEYLTLDVCSFTEINNKEQVIILKNCQNNKPNCSINRDDMIDYIDKEYKKVKNLENYLYPKNPITREKIAFWTYLDLHNFKMA